MTIADCIARLGLAWDGSLEHAISSMSEATVWSNEPQPGSACIAHKRYSIF